MDCEAVEKGRKFLDRFVTRDSDYRLAVENKIRDVINADDALVDLFWRNPEAALRIAIGLILSANV